MIFIAAMVGFACGATAAAVALVILSVVGSVRSLGDDA